MTDPTAQKLKQELANLNPAQLHIVLQHMVREISQAMAYELECSKPKPAVEDVDLIISYITRSHDDVIYWLHGIATDVLQNQQRDEA